MKYKNWMKLFLLAGRCSSVLPRQTAATLQFPCGCRFSPSVVSISTQTTPTSAVESCRKEPSKWTSKIIYSSYLQQFQPKESYRRRLKERAKEPALRADQLVKKVSNALPVICTLVDESLVSRNEDEVQDCEPEDLHQQEEVHFPYKHIPGPQPHRHPSNAFDSSRYKSEADKLTKRGLDVDSIVSQVDESGDKEWIPVEEIGTPNPKVYPSSVPCGGCGAFLHCQQPSIPGYLPSERFTNLSKEELRGEICLRCFCLQNYNASLNVNVKPEDYPKILEVIKNKFAMVILLVDLTDFPCSVWPGIVDIIGTKRPVFLVGNKVDLLPRDSDNYLQHVEYCLQKSAHEAGLRQQQILYTALISARTGFGVEDLISRIFKLWEVKGDIFIVGCTNVGKSSLFNAFINSDLCKLQIIDYVRRATVSQWPGTTLNLLKFPIMRPDKWKMVLRSERLEIEGDVLRAESKERALSLRETENKEHSILIGHVGRTFLSHHKADSAEKPVLAADPFRVPMKSSIPPEIKKPGQWDPDDPQVQGSWCYDTPGTVSHNQILDILTLPELMITLPKKFIEPRTYFIKVGISLFIGGLARLDYIDGFKPIRYTVFASEQMPITIVETKDADEFYEHAIGSPIFQVPSGTKERLEMFPILQPTAFNLKTVGHDCSCADIVLSSAGWVAVTGGIGHDIRLVVHTPDGKGVFCREPALLPYTVNSKGKRLRDTPAYLPHSPFIPSLKGRIY